MSSPISPRESIRVCVRHWRSAVSPRLYTHQADAFDHVAAGKNTVVVTPTASGKTLCYNLPVLNLLLADDKARAMYIFPTKALAEDQLHEFNSAVEAMGSDIRAFTYDGDTPQDARKAIRQKANVVLTNPDMLHSGILPHHTRWARYFENLRYIVIDELHYYRGVYGSHFANLLRRLARICEFYGSKPQFICCSATIANPRELAQALTGQEFELVERNGAPRGEKFFVFYNPPVVNRQLGIRRSYIGETRRLAMEFIEPQSADAGVCQQPPGHRGPGHVPEGRLRARSRSQGNGARLPRRLPAQGAPRDRTAPARRRDPRGGGHQRPGTGHRHRLAGRGGNGWISGHHCVQLAACRTRRAAARRISAAVLVASSAPLDQYIVEHPDFFFGRSPEHAYINPENLEILIAHLKCAAFELPIRDGEKFGQHDTAEICQFLQEGGFLHHSGGAWHWTQDSYPADASGLRSVASDNFVVIDITGEANVIAEVSFSTALTTLHEKAIYLHEARQYHVERFEYDERKAYVKAVDCDYYTDAIDYTQVKVLEEFGSRAVRRRAAAARRRAGQSADCRVQEDQVLHHGKRRGREAEHARAGNAHHVVLAALPGRFSGAIRRIYAHRKAERHQRPWQCVARGRRSAADVRPARSGRRDQRGIGQWPDDI